MILRRELRRATPLAAERRSAGFSSRRGRARLVSERHGLRRGHCPLGGRMEEAPDHEDDPAEELDRDAAIRMVRAAARGYCLTMALADARDPQRRQKLKSASRLLRFAHLLESGGIQYSSALAVALARLLRRAWD